jgi:hypothetical protein
MCVADEHYMPTLLASYGLDGQVCACTAAMDSNLEEV